ncbi:MAG: RNA 2',3'-cyclic phosphodiesterase [Pseudomonadota bacterium]
MPRLFAGIEIPEDLSEDLAGLEQPLPGARWINPANHHITLRFFGDVPKRTADELIDLLALIQRDIFHVTVCGLSLPNGREPQALWAGVENSDALSRLQSDTERVARSVGLPPEKRTFRPHITVARLNRPHEFALARILQRYARLQVAPFVVPRFVLYSSKPHSGGGPYVLEQMFPLIGGSWDDEATAW